MVGRDGELGLFAELLRERSRCGVLVCGPAGVGKTRLADEFLRIAQVAGRRHGRVTGSVSAAGIPLGALAHLVPPAVSGPRSGPVALFDGVATAFRAGSGTGPFVLLVDDLHLLDVTSLALVIELIEAGVVFLVGTVRTGEPVPDAVSALWRSGRLARVDLPELDRASVEEVLCTVLGGPVEAATVDEIHRIGQGNMLYVRELVRGAETSGRFVEDRGAWRLAGPPVGTAALVEVVETTMRKLPRAARGVLELLALVDTIGVADLDGILGTDILESLEAAGHVGVRADGRRLDVTLGHPLYGEVLRAQLPVLTRRRLLSEHADRLERHGARRRGDPLRIATWRLDATGSADPDLLLTAARLARHGHDFGTVRRLAGAALAATYTAEAGVLLGEALFELGAGDEAETVLAQAEAAVTDEADVVAVTGPRARNLMWGLLLPERALAVIQAARQRITGSAGGDELRTVEARVLIHLGRPTEALTLVAPLAGAPDLRIRALAAVPRASALTVTGRCETAAAVARDGYADQVRIDADQAMVPASIHVILEVYALIEAGRLAEAADRAAWGRDLAARERSGIGRVWFAYYLGRCALFAGRVSTAQRWLSEAAGLCRSGGHPWLCRLTMTAFAAAAAAAGDTEAARRAVEESGSYGDISHLHPEHELGRAWVAAATQDLAGARTILLAAAAEAGTNGQHSSEALLLHDVVRLGGAPRVAERLTELAVRCEGPLVRGYAAHARAAAARHPDLLASVVEEFDELGAHLYAAEAAVAAAHAYQGRGRFRKATLLHARASLLRRTCEGARTPGLVTAASITPLTDRERQIATLAADGVTSREIAVRLHVSARTVENHLQHAYAKLGVSTRVDLSAVLHPEP
jgi:DNA-binding CsgD family transcriptional regulator